MFKEFLSELGITHVGAAEIPSEFRPYSSLPRAISIGVPLSKTIVSSIQDGPTHTYFHHYRGANAFLDSVALRLMLRIESQGYCAVYVPASQTVDREELKGLFSHKMAAVLSSLEALA